MVTTPLTDDRVFRLACQAAPIGVVVADAGEADNPLVFANRRFLELTGYDQSEIVGRNCRFLQGPETDPDRVEELRRAIDEERPASVELVNYRKDGTPFWNAVDVAPVTDPDGAVTHFVGFQRDVTDRREAQRRLEHQNERLSQFANVISHDLKNPLNVLSVSLDLAEETGDPEHFEKCRETVDRMNEMIEDLLVLAREGEAVGDPEAVDLSAVIDDCWGQVNRPDATLRNAVDRPLLADRDRLVQVLENLFVNAVEHGGDDVTVTVGELEDGFYVEDDGPGIPPEDREQVFEAGYTTARDGSGFGLQIVRQLAEAHGWEIELTTGEAGGARFEITGVERP